MLKNRTTYEIMNPQDVGWEGTKLIVGKHSGRAGFKNALQELGIKLDDEQLQARTSASSSWLIARSM